MVSSEKSLLLAADRESIFEYPVTKESGYKTGKERST
jgi:hypothetical protein